MACSTVCSGTPVTTAVMSNVSQSGASLDYKSEVYFKRGRDPPPCNVFFSYVFSLIIFINSGISDLSKIEPAGRHTHRSSKYV
jgi:hypothetical protein